VELGALARACVHCGICLPACPTYRVGKEEADSPRGRVLLLDALAAGRAGAATVRPHLDRCIGCRACESVCPSGVPFGQLLEEGRAALGGPRPMLRFLLRGVLPHPRLVALLAGAARLLGRAPPRARPRPWPEPPARARARVGLHLGCVTPHLFPHLAADAAHALTRAGYRVDAPAGQACCGALHRHAGLDAGALAAANRRAFAGCDFVASAAAGCSTTEGFTDVCRLLLEAPPDGARLPAPVRVAWHPPCHLLAQGIDAAPLLDAIEGVERIALPAAAGCCGAGGAYMELQPALARAVREASLDAIAASGAQVVATANPGCMLWLARGLRERGLAVPVVHPVSLLAEALP